MYIHVTVDLLDTPEQVWNYLADARSHTEWMHDALSITLTSEKTEGVGTTFDCLTGVGPIKTVDKMEIVGWEDNHLMGVRHQGLVSGEGQFNLDPIPEGTRFSWVEDLKLPWLFGGPIGEVFAKPILQAIWRRNLQGLKNQIALRRVSNI